MSTHSYDNLIKVTKDLSDRDTFTKYELDTIAINHCGMVAHLSYGSVTRRAAPKNQHGYIFKWVDTRGVMNHGKLVLIPGCSDSYRKLKKGFITYWMRELHLTFNEAAKLHNASKIDYGREIDVIKYCLLTCRNVAWNSFPGKGKGIARWYEDAEMPDISTDQFYKSKRLGDDRLDAVYRLMKNWMGLPQPTVTPRDP